MFGVGFGIGAIGATTKINSGVAFNYLLDTYSGSSVAYSLRKLSSTYTGSCIRVRRSSDNTEQNIGFVSNVLDTASLLSFVGSNNGFITTWYDQSGNSNNSIQATASNQPQIVSSGALITNNGLPSVNFSTNHYIFTNVSLNFKSVFTVSKVDTYVQLQSLLYFTKTSDNSAGPWVRSIDVNYYRSVSTGGCNSDDYTFGSNMYFNNHLHITSDNFLNPHVLSSFGDKTAYKIGLGGGYYSRFYMGKISEVIGFSSDVASTRSDINTQINSFYGIY